MTRAHHDGVTDDVHDVPLAELNGLHAKTVDCPCGTHVEHVTAKSAIVYHSRRTPSRWDNR